MRAVKAWKIGLENKLYLFSLFGIVTLSLILFWTSFQNYFSQDDFFLFKISQAKNISEFFNFFSLGRPYTFYRPLSTEVYFFLNQTLFGMNLLPFRIESFLFFWANIFLVYLITWQLVKNKLVSILASFFYGVSAVHFGALHWSAAFQMINMAFFYFLTFYLYLLYRQKSKPIFYIFSLIGFCLALLSMELTVTLPLILLIYEILFLKRPSRGEILSILSRLFPFLIILLIYAGFHLLARPLPLAETYQVNLAPKPLLGNLRWYVLWSFGLPEMLIDYIGPGLHINPNLFKFYRTPILITVVWALGFLILILVSLFLILKKRTFQILREKIFWFSILWFEVAVLPVVSFQWHKFSYYLTIAHFGFSLFLAFLLIQLFKVINSKYASLLILSILLIFFLGNLNTVKLTHKTNWVVSRAKLAKSILDDLKKNHPNISGDSVIYFLNDPNSPKINPQWGFSSTQAYVALSGSNAVQVLYKNREIKVYYEDISPPPANVGKEKIIEIVAPAQR